MAGLDYDRYGAQGGDWGAMISTNLALVDPGHCVGLHLNMPIGGPPPAERPLEPDAGRSRRAGVDDRRTRTSTPGT